MKKKKCIIPSLTSLFTVPFPPFLNSLTVRVAILYKSLQLKSRLQLILGYTDDILGSKDEILGYTDDILGSKDEIFGYTDDILGYTEDILGYTDNSFQDICTDDILGYTDDILG